MLDIQALEEDNQIFDEDEDTQKDKYLIFYLNQQNYGLEIQHVLEIVGAQKITEVPDVPNFIKGLINLRGQVIPVVDVRLRFEMPPKPYNDRTCVIVVSNKDLIVGLIVDQVKEVIDIPEEKISLPPKQVSAFNRRYVQGLGKIGEQVKILLNLDRVLYDEDTENVSEGKNV